MGEPERASEYRLEGPTKIDGEEFEVTPRAT
jgi:hypothetical protein